LFDAEKIAKEMWHSPVYELKQVCFVVGWRAMVDFKAVCAGLLLWGRPVFNAASLQINIQKQLVSFSALLWVHVYFFFL
jgi:hypothetical protein